MLALFVYYYFDVVFLTKGSTMTVNSYTFPAKGIHFAIHKDGKEVARAKLYLVENDLHEKPYGLLEDVYVDPKFRKHGYGAEIVKAVIDRAKQEHCYKLIATSRKARKKVHSLYRKLGFIMHGYEFRMDIT